MNINHIHGFNLKEESEFISIQEKLKKKINIDKKVSLDSIKLCAGVDIAYWEERGETFGACSIVIIDFITKEVIEKVESYGKIEVPYIPGYLAFRELPLIMEAVKKLTIEPDIFMFDGNGYLHPNNMGIATHASFFLNKPTVGVAKSYFKVHGIDYVEPEDRVGAYSEIKDINIVMGITLRSRKGVKPIFVSCGNYIDLDSAYNIVMNLLSNDSRVPIPTRVADIETHILRDKYRNK